MEQQQATDVASADEPSEEARRDLGEFLIEAGKLRPVDLARVRRVQSEQGENQRLSRLLVKLGTVGERDVAEALAKLCDLPMVKSEQYPDEPVLGDLLSPRFMSEHLVVPLEASPERVVVAIADPQDQAVCDMLAFACNRPVQLRVGLPSDIEAAVTRQVGEDEQDAAAADAIDTDVADDDIEHLKDLASEAPVIRIVNQMLQRATELGASDIHVEPFDGVIKIRYRIDGVLNEMEPPPPHLGAAIVSRIKIMARLDIAERRMPQDGRIRLRVQGSDFDLRVSTIPTMHGESVVLRLLNRESIAHDFTSLGFADDVRERFEEVLRLPHGMILLTGPTGSGKTTTLYAALSLLNTPERKIITVEDPVEYQLEGINQIQAKPTIGLTFANALRSIVRQDPDVIMVGEMRDLETASISIQSALTGHLVLSTLHTNDAISTVARLLEMGVEDYLLTATLNAVIAQRLVRVLCKHCRRPVEYGGVLQLRVPGLAAYLKPNDTLYAAAGCPECNGTGYRGRTTIQELLIIDDRMRGLIMAREDNRRMEEAARAGGMRPIYEEGLRKVAEGITSLEEVERVTRES